MWYYSGKEDSDTIEWEKNRQRGLMNDGRQGGQGG